MDLASVNHLGSSMNSTEVRTPFHITTPLLESLPLSRRLGLPVYLKCENCQPSASFKLRGIGHFILQKYKAGVRNFVIASGGNAGLATAYSTYKLGVPATIVIPESSPTDVAQLLKEYYGAKVIVHGEAWDEANEEALRIASQPGHTYVHPFDDPLVWEGHSSMITEIREQLGGQKPCCIVTVVGGGGLLCGVLEGLKKHNWEDVPIVVMETEGAASYYSAIKARKLITLPKITSIAVCLGAKTVCQRAFDAAVKKEHRIFSYTVTDEDALNACHQFLDDHRVLVEPACGAGLAAIYTGVLKNAWNEGLLLKSGPVVLIICGGGCVTFNTLTKLKTKIGVL